MIILHFAGYYKKVESRRRSTVPELLSDKHENFDCWKFFLMKLSKEDEILLERWMVKELQYRHKNNPSVLAQYIISLLREDKPDESTLKAHCVEEARPFLKEHSRDFVSLVFAAINGTTQSCPSLTSLFLLKCITLNISFFLCF